MKGVLAWITCPKVLEQFKRDLALTACSYIEDLPNETSVPEPCGLRVKDNSIVLEEYAFTVKEKENNDTAKATKLANWLADCLFDEASYWNTHLRQNLVVLPNEDFTDFVNLSTEVITRTKINNETGTVQDGALFTEEYLPAESVLYSLALFSPLFHTATKVEPFMGYIKDQNLNNLEAKDADKKAIRNSQKEVEAVESFFKSLPQIIQIGGNVTLGKGLVRTKMWEV